MNIIIFSNPPYSLHINIWLIENWMDVSHLTISLYVERFWTWMVIGLETGWRFLQVVWSIRSDINLILIKFYCRKDMSMKWKGFHLMISEECVYIIAKIIIFKLILIRNNNMSIFGCKHKGIGMKHKHGWGDIY